MVIERVGVVIPAHDEEDLLPACLEAVHRAAGAVTRAKVQVVVVLDSCADASAEIVRTQPWATVVEVDARNVGAARAAGAAELLRWAAATATDRIWLATTDADSVVPDHWLTGQLELAAAGWEVVVGTVEVDDWSEHPPEVGPRWARTYQPVDHHPHVHGANLGCTAAAYLEVGGWSPVELAEDVALVAALAHRKVIRTASVPVLTSARRNPRAAGGFGDALGALAG